MGNFVKAKRKKFLFLFINFNNQPVQRMKKRQINAWYDMHFNVIGQKRLNPGIGLTWESVGKTGITWSS